ncbi:MAG TPA: ATP-binding protein [Spirochaetota bacterium]|nr:ATP-binding protein [Spirochaetota bacterium]
MTNEHEITFLDSLAADTIVVPQVIDNLINDLKRMSYPKDDIDEIILSMDEAITNAIQETVRKEETTRTADDNERRKITIRYSIREDNFDATIIDHGKGLDLSRLKGFVPNIDSSNYYDQIVKYASESEKNRLTVRVNGKEITLKGIGVGLKVILAFMDSVSIDLIDKERVLANSVSEFTDGTILNLNRRRRYTA